jgi:hypothetical protein
LQSTHFQEAIEVFDPTSGRSIRYETYFPDRPVPYSKAAHEKLRTSSIVVGDQEEIADDCLNPGSVIREDFYIDDDDDFSDVMEYQCSGVADILVTGEVRTSDFHGIFVSACPHPTQPFFTSNTDRHTLSRPANVTVMHGATLLTLAG